MAPVTVPPESFAPWHQVEEQVTVPVVWPEVGDAPPALATLPVTGNQRRLMEWRIAWAKAHPGQLNFAIGALGSSSTYMPA